MPLLYSLLQPNLVITGRPPNQQLLLQLNQNDVCVFWCSKRQSNVVQGNNHLTGPSGPYYAKNMKHYFLDTPVVVRLLVCLLFMMRFFDKVTVQLPI